MRLLIHLRETGKFQDNLFESNAIPSDVLNSLGEINIDKKGVAELYDYFGLMDTLFPLTRSCEDWTDDFSAHCGKCWFCLERLWGFGKL